MQARRFLPLLLVTGALCALTACPGTTVSVDNPTAPSTPKATFLFRGSVSSTVVTAEPILWLYPMRVTPTSTSYTLARSTTTSATGTIENSSTVNLTVPDSAAKAAVSATLSDLFANKTNSFGCSGSVSVSQDTKIVVYDRVYTGTLTAPDTTHYLTFDRIGSNGGTQVHHMLFYAIGAGKAFGTASCTFGSGKEVINYTTNIVVKPGWNLYADSAASSTSFFETISSNDTTYTGPYVVH